MKALVIYIDGASRGNPGPASYGVCIQDPSGNTCLEVNEFIGTATNNIAEYSALVRALKEARKLGADEVSIYTDSELVARQFDGTYKVKREKLRALLAEARKLEPEFSRVTVQHIPRSSHPGNKRADKLANIAINKFGPEA